VEGDNCCFCNTSALKDTINVQDQDLVYASFHNDVFRTPFFLAVDHSTKSIVLAIRGTMSLRDTVTDLTAEAKPLETPGLPPEFKAHSGMILAAKHVYDKLDQLRVLQKAMAQYPEYNLIFTGHSLGAGTATILSIMMRPRYPNIRCYAYSPPGGLLTLEAARHCEDFTTSVILGDDIVSRLSVPSFEKFKKKLQDAIKDCKAPKYRILVGGCWYLFVGGIPKRLICEDDSLLQETRSDTQLLNGASTESTTNYHTYVSLVEESHRLHREAVTQCPMYPPGKIMHVTRRPIFDSRPELMEGPKYQYRWADRTEFSEILVTPNMMTEHYPDNVYRALEDISNQEPPSFPNTHV
jgi:sn1-specific diacylglycerol lipase